MCILNVADRHAEYAYMIKKQLLEEGFSCSVDDSNESVGKKVRNAQLNQINYILTVGDNELANNTIALRTRNNYVVGEITTKEFIEKIISERLHRDLESPFSREQES